MLQYHQREEISRFLLQLPDLVKQQENGSSDFVSNVNGWLSATEEFLKSCRLPQAGRLASLRSLMVAASQGQVPAEITFRGRATQTKILKAVAADALQRAETELSSLLALNESRFADATRISCQIAAVATSRKLIVERTRHANNTDSLRELRQRLSAMEDLENAVLSLEGIVGLHDALIFLDRAFAPYFEPVRAITSQ